MKKTTIKLTNEEFKSRLLAKFPDYEILGSYTNMRTKVLLRCKKHDITFLANPHSLLIEGKKACPKCILSDRSATFIKEVKKFPNLQLLDEYKSYREPLRFLCKIHNVIFTLMPENFIRKINKGDNICPNCVKEQSNNKKLISWIKKFNSNFPNHRFDFSNAIWIVKNKKAKIINIKCLDCGHVFEVNPSYFINIGKCSNCQTKSIGEKLVSDWLSNHNLNFKEQVYFSNDKIIGKKPHWGVIIDFLVDYKNNQYIIECNGEFHYTLCPKLQTTEAFEAQLNRDKNVKEYCAANNIIFIEIPWTYYNKSKVDYILNSVFIDGVESISSIIKIPSIKYER